MDPHSDDSWEPDPGNPDPDDLCTYEGKEHDMEEPYAYCDNRYSLPHKVPSSYGSGLEVNSGGGTSHIPMPDRVDTLPINSGTTLTYDYICKFKRPKQGMHGNQVSTSHPLYSMCIQLVCKPNHSGSKEGSRRTSSKMERRGRESGSGQALILFVMNCQLQRGRRLHLQRCCTTSTQRGQST
jgi:hypothetical protein